MWVLPATNSNRRGDQTMPLPFFFLFALAFGCHPRRGSASAFVFPSTSHKNPGASIHRALTMAGRETVHTNLAPCLFLPLFLSLAFFVILAGICFFLLPFSAQKSHVKPLTPSQPHKTQQPRTFRTLSRLANSLVQTRIIEIGDKFAMKR
jgi:hypothetical protein